MKPNRKNPILLARLSFPLVVLFNLTALPAYAASDSWNLDAAGNWTTFGSWLSGTQAPGSTSADNSDIATFDFTLTTGRIVTVDTARYIGGISFGNTSNFGYTLSGGSLILNTGGVIQTLAGNGNHTDTISSPIRISGTSAATAFFTANATSATSLLSIGAVTGSATLGNTTTLTLNGTNTGLNSVTGIIGDGLGGGKLALTKDGTGTWLLSGANTFTGGVIINRGTLALDYTNLATPTNLFAATNALSLGGGALTITGKNSATNTSQTFASTALNAGVNTINIAKGATATSATINLGTLTVNPGSVTTIFTGTAGSTTWATGLTPTSEIIKVSSITGKTLPASSGTANWINVNAGLFYRTSTSAGSVRYVSVDDQGQLQGLPLSTIAIAAGTNDSRLAYSLANNVNIVLTTDTNPSIYGLLANAAANPSTLTLPNSGSLTLNGVIQTNTGLSTINAGTGTSNLVIGSEKNLVINMDNTGGVTINAPIVNNGGGASAVTIVSTIPSGTPGNVTFGGANTYTGATNLLNRTLILTNANPFGTTPGTNGTSGITMTSGSILSSNIDGLAIAAPITLSGVGNAAIRVGNTAALNSTFSGGIGGSTGNLIFTTSYGNFNPQSVISLGATSNYTGNTTITTGSIQNNLTVSSGATNALSPGTVLTMNGVGGSSTASGRAVTFNLNGNNQTLAGLTNVTSAFATSRNQRITNSGALATLTINNTADYTYGGATRVDATNFGNAQITGAIALTKSGTGTFTLGGPVTGAGVVTPGNTFTGDTKITGGILVLNESISIQNSAFDTTNSITGNLTNGLRTTVTSLTMGGLTGNKNFADVFTATTGGYIGLTALTLNPGASVTNSYSADIGNGNGSMTLTKSGLGTQVLTNTQTYTGATSITAGTLLVNGSTHASSAVSVAAGTLTGTPVATLGGTGTINGTLSLAGESATGFKNGGVLAPGDAGVVDIETLDAGTTTWNGGSIWNFDLSSSNNTSDQLAITGDFVKGTGSGFEFDFMGTTPAWNTTYTLVTWSSLIATNFSLGDFSFTNLGAGPYGASSFTLNANSLTFTAVPEPTSALAGLLITAGLLRRRRK